MGLRRIPCRQCEAHIDQRGKNLDRRDLHMGLRSICGCQCEPHSNESRKHTGPSELHTPPCTKIPRPCEAHISLSNKSSGLCEFQHGENCQKPAQRDARNLLGKTISDAKQGRLDPV